MKTRTTKMDRSLLQMQHAAANLADDAKNRPYRDTRVTGAVRRVILASYNHLLYGESHKPQLIGALQDLQAILSD